MFFSVSVACIEMNMLCVRALDGSCGGSRSRESLTGIVIGVRLCLVDCVFFCCIRRWPLLVNIDFG